MTSCKYKSGYHTSVYRNVASLLPPTLQLTMNAKKIVYRGIYPNQTSQSPTHANPIRKNDKEKSALSGEEDEKETHDRLQGCDIAQIKEMAPPI
jgi:hypothetical protein